MYKTVGTILKKSELCSAWEIGRRYSFDVYNWRSVRFKDPFLSNEWCFYLDRQTWELGLWRRKDYRLLLLDVHILIKSSNGRNAEEFTLRKVRKCMIGDHASYDKFILGIISIADPSTIYCTFSKIIDFEDSFQELPVEDEIEDDLLSNKGSNDANKKRIVQTYKGENNLVKQRGLTTLSENLRNLLLSEEDTDVVIKVADRKYPVHKLILKVRSTVFQTMLGNMSNDSNGVLDINDCDPDVFRAFLFYLYDGKLENITTDNVLDLFHMSHKFSVKQLKRDCVEFLSNNLTVEVFGDYISLAIDHSVSEMMKLAAEFFIENTREILKTTKWKIFLQDKPVVANELFIKAYSSKRRPVEVSHKTT